jgi:hypothetical protein
MNLTRGATDRRAFRGPKALNAPGFAPGILAALFVVWVAFCTSFSKFAKVQLSFIKPFLLIIHSLMAIIAHDRKAPCRLLHAV